MNSRTKRLSTRPKFIGWKDGLGRGHGLLKPPVTLPCRQRSLTSRTGSSLHEANLLRLQQVQRLTRRTFHSSNRFNVCPDSTTSTTRVPILTSKSWNEVWANGFDDQTEKRIPANCCDTTTFYLSHVQLVFSRPCIHYRSADHSIMRQSHDCHTGDQPAGATVPVHWTWTRVRHAHKRCTENHCDYSWNMKQLTNCHSRSEHLQMAPKITKTPHIGSLEWLHSAVEMLLLALLLQLYHICLFLCLCCYLSLSDCVSS